MSCDSCEWMLLPCKRAMITIQFTNMDLKQDVYPHFSVDYHMHTYLPKFDLLPQPYSWPK